MSFLLASLLLATASNPGFIALDKEKTPSKKMEELAQNPGSVTFDPPANWRLADIPKEEFPNVEVMVVGKGQGAYPPSLNLTVTPFVGSLKDYLRIVKAKNDKTGDEWKDLGVIRTDAGDASLSQADRKTKWGQERLMHVILVRNEHVYILTAAALKDEFPSYYKDFFTSFRSLKINKDVYDRLTDLRKRAALHNAIQELKFQWDDYAQRAARDTRLTPDEGAPLRLFEGTDFQEKYWNAFKTYLNKDFADMPSTWHIQVLAHARHILLTPNATK